MATRQARLDAEQDLGRSLLPVLAGWSDEVDDCRGADLPVEPQTGLPFTHHGLAGTPWHGLAMVASPVGSGCMTTPVWRG